MGGTWVYKILGETPAKKNGQSFNTRRKTMYKSGPFRRWHDNALKTLLCFARPDFPLEFAEIFITFFHADLTRRDGDNALASVQDLLQDAGIIKDDSWVRIGTPIVVHDVAPAPYCMITVKEAEAPKWAEKLAAIRKALKQK